MTTSAPTPAAPARLDVIDQYRGFVIILMVIVNFLAGVRPVPAWLKHAPDIGGLTFVDLIAPAFIFMVGLTYGLSFRKRLDRAGAGATLQHFISRSLALIGLGSLMSVIAIWASVYPDTMQWGVLQAIGMAELLTLPVIWFKLNHPWRWLIGLGLLAGYQYMFDHSWSILVTHSPQGGPLGSLSWAALLILGTSLADLYHTQAADRYRRAYLGMSLATLAAGIGAASFVTVSMYQVSASYVLITLGAGSLVFWIFHMLAQHLSMRVVLLTMWGRNALALFVLHFGLIGIFRLPAVPGWYTDAPAWLTLLQVLAILACLSGLSWFWYRRNWMLKL